MIFSGFVWEKYRVIIIYSYTRPVGPQTEQRVPAIGFARKNQVVCPKTIHARGRFLYLHSRFGHFTLGCRNHIAIGFHA